MASICVRDDGGEELVYANDCIEDINNVADLLVSHCYLFISLTMLGLDYYPHHGLPPLSS